MSAATNWKQRYTPAQLKAAESMDAIRARQMQGIADRAAAALQANRDAIEQAEADAKAREAARLNCETRSRLVIRATNEKVEIAARKFKLEARESGAKSTSMCASPSLRSITRATMRVALAYNVSPVAIMGHYRHRLVVAARHHMIALLFIDNPQISLTSVGKELGMDHTSVLHAVACYNRHFGTTVKNVRPCKPPRTPFLFREIPPREPGPLVAMMEAP
jgi:Bacterial dnaA protein helix-turn-helix